ncbi:DUF4919 domain-containing protein [Acidisoma cellulosilytica]|uniref:DUF4919 domain-containing protein n=1 Tax=Acidisoma cellulosilyticum TaxID=2802395 RepID=A0A963Z6Y2_9PROT|nr:DUF4919 domain-containing protein [Acidisoma cellulosilyticum]MCB8883960.1 DUF4919 domain-containing protein [Acidisoma cellulosilyticum]
MLVVAKTNPGGTDWTALRAAYAASPAFDPSVGQSQAIRASIAALQAGNSSEALEQAEADLRINWMDLRGHMLAATAKVGLNGPNPSDPDLLAAEGIIRAIHATGDGQTPETAPHVLGASEEHVLLALGHLKEIQQRLVRINGHSFDVLTVIDTRTGSQGGVYFNVDTLLARETALATGQAQVVPVSVQ